MEVEQPKTKQVSSFLRSLEVEGRVLFLGSGTYKEIELEDVKQKVSVSGRGGGKNFSLSVRNLPKAQYKLAKNVSGYDIMASGFIVVEESAWNEIVEWLS